MADDPRVILIKLADRLDNMRTLGNLRPEKQKRIARETLNFFCPIADRFGLGAMKKELEERCFHHLNCGVYEGLEKRINVIRDRRRQDGESLCATIEQKLKEAGLEAYVQIEKDGVYSVFRRIQRLNIKSTESIHDLNSVEALTNLDPVKAVPDLDSVEAILDLDSIVVVVSGDTTDCFSAERALSSYSHWNYENYINTPKANRYQAIHFTISSEGKNCWRIRICSEDGYKLYVIGGTLVAIGGLENGANLSQACYQADWNKGTWYALYADDKPVFAFKTPERGGNSLVVSTSGTPALKSGVSVSGGTSLFDGLGAVDGSVSGGSAVTLSAYVGGMGGPGGGAPGGGHGR